MLVRIAALASAIMTAASLAAGATTLTFSVGVNDVVYTEAGMTFTAFGESEAINTGDTLGLNCCDPPAAINWRLTTGGLFNLDSIRVVYVGSATPITFTGKLGGATVATQDFSFSSPVGLFAFTGFTGLDEVTMSAILTVNAGVAFDDLTYTAAAIPAPPALPLLLAGLAGLAIARRRSR